MREGTNRREKNKVRTLDLCPLSLLLHVSSVVRCIHAMPPPLLLLHAMRMHANPPRMHLPTLSRYFLRDSVKV